MTNIELPDNPDSEHSRTKKFVRAYLTSVKSAGLLLVVIFVATASIGIVSALFQGQPINISGLLNVMTALVALALLLPQIWLGIPIVFVAVGKLLKKGELR